MFSAGNDLQEFSQAATSGEGLALPVVRFLHALARSERPLVAAVQGLAVGVGTTMLLHCDHVVAGADARFSTPFVSLGLVPEAASSLLAPRLMGHRRAFELLVMGRPLDAAAAQAAASSTRSYRRAMSMPRPRRPLSTSPRCRPQAVAASRRLMRGSLDETIARIDEEVRLFKERLQSAEAQAAFSAFLTRKR